MKIDAGGYKYNGKVDIGDLPSAIDFKVAKEDMGYTKKETVQAY